MDTTINSLGACNFETPLRWSPKPPAFASDGSRVLFDHSLEAVRSAIATGQEPASFEIAGHRDRVYFDGPRTTAGIVTCGGLCPISANLLDTGPAGPIGD
jgi:6-phosphofructokinase 1